MHYALQFFELSNFHTHLKLRSLRPPGTKIRAIPYGYGYNLVSLPNYFFEIMIWLTICVLTNSIAGTFVRSPSFQKEIYILLQLGFLPSAELYRWSYGRSRSTRTTKKNLAKSIHQGGRP